MIWPFKDNPAPAAPTLVLRQPKTPIPEGYESEWEAIQREAETMFRAGRGPSGAVDALAREIVALKARLDKHGIGE